MLLASTANAARTLTVTFTYPETENANITGFRLMREGGVLDTDKVPPTVPLVCGGLG